MKKTIGFIGCGHLAKAMIDGIQNSNIAKKYTIIASSLNKKPYKDIKITNNTEVAKSSDILILAVSPKIMKSILKEINPFICDGKVVVSVAAGISINYIKCFLDKNVKIVRSMPNYPIKVSEGMTALCGDTEDEILELFRCFGKAEIVDESCMDVVTSISGSSPAYVYLYIDYMIKAAQKLGMNKDLAEIFASQAILGSAKMVLEYGNPSKLCDDVCTPGGTTIEAIKELKDSDLEELIFDAMKACANRSKQLSK